MYADLVSEQQDDKIANILPPLKWQYYILVVVVIVVLILAITLLGDCAFDLRKSNV